MPIIITLDVLMARHKMTLTELSELTGITMANLSLFRGGYGKGVRFKTLEKICGVFDCKPGEIMTIMSEEEYDKLLLGRPRRRPKKRSY